MLNTLDMVPSSYLRIYQPLASFPPQEQELWTRYIESNPQLPIEPQYKHVAFNAESRTGMLFPATDEHAYLRKVGGQWLVCPWRVRLRVLVGLLAFRNALFPDAADAWVPEEAALAAAGELEEMRETEPEMKSNITTASWHVPLRWFIAFDDSERVTIEEKATTARGNVRTRLRVRYETEIRTAKTRVDRGLKILREAGMAESQCGPVADLAEWINDFSYDSVIELDYGTVADLFSNEELHLDRSAGEIWSCLEALSDGDYEASANKYNDLAAWWNRVKSLESAN